MQTVKEKKELKKLTKVSLKNYYQLRKPDDPDTLLDIINYATATGKLPFLYDGEHMVYDVIIERQKKKGVELGQFPTPPAVARQIAQLTQSFSPKDNKVLNACCGAGIIAQELIKEGLQVEAFDIDPNMVEVCNKRSRGKAEFFTADYSHWEETDKWDLIISYPVLVNEPDIYSYLKFLRQALTPDGNAILILPDEFFKTKYNNMIKQLIKSFQLSHEVELETKDKGTAKSKIYIIEFSEHYRNIIQGTETPPTIKAPEPLSTNEVAEVKAIEVENPEKAQELKPTSELLHIPLEKIRLNPNNPRKNIFENNELEELANSISQFGVLQPILLNEIDDYYEIIFGERRYQASVTAGKTTIPAFTCKESREKALEIALVENLQRKDMTPIEEAEAFKLIMDIRKETVEEIADYFGKSKQFIRERLALLTLINEFKVLLEQGLLSVSKAYELCRFKSDTQKLIYDKYFLVNDTSGWYRLTLKEFRERLRNYFITDLAEYSFDKTQCHKCPHNTVNQTLFTDIKDARCTNFDCLEEKKTEYMKQTVQEIKKEKPEMGIYISPDAKLSVPIRKEISEHKVEMMQNTPVEIPQEPIKPHRENFLTEVDYEVACYEYEADLKAYHEETQNLEKAEEAGKIKKVLYATPDNPRECYTQVEEPIVEETIESLKKQLKRSEDLIIPGILNDVQGLTTNNELKSSNLSKLEERLLIYLMIPYIQKHHYQLIGLPVSVKITDELQYELLNCIKPEHHPIIKRDFLLHHLIQAKGNSKKTLLFFEFMKDNLPKEFNDIYTIHLNRHTQESKEINKKIKALEKKQKSTPKTDK